MPGTLRPVAPWIWALLTVVGLTVATVVAFALTFGVMRLLVTAAVPDAGAATGLRLDLALFLAIATALGLGAVLAAARLAFGAWVVFRSSALVAPALGLVLGIAVELVLHEWARARFGYYDSDFIGPTAALSLALVLTGISTFAVLTAPSQAILPPLIAVAACAAAVVAIVGGNVAGLGDGIAAESLPLASVIALATVYAVAALAVSALSAARRARRGRYRRMSGDPRA